jgi:hypothetical protein
MIITLIAVFIVILSNFGNTSRFFSAQNVVQYILDGTMQKAQTCVFYHMTYNNLLVLPKLLKITINIINLIQLYLPIVLLEILNCI